MEAEFVATSKVACESLREVGIKPALLMQLHVDNQAAISQIAGEASSLKAKDVDLRYKFLSDFSWRKIIAASFVRSEGILVDLMTKALNATKLASMRVS